ncbi:MULTISPECIES: helicase-related protein [unclassified Agarivorans]|uniref:helicase-related protein n=1 Tax=unclassified Agarivorans TaxID=2636026 RepID=UPI003D7CB76F
MVRAETRSLPIDSIKSKFLSDLADNHVVVEAATGSGKSTRLPRWASQFGKVLVVQPRRIACEALAAYVAQQERVEQGTTEVGYAIRFASTLTSTTDIAYVTPGIALHWLAENNLANYAVIMIDEFHERRWDSDLLLALVKDLPLRIVVTSATLEGAKLCDYLGAKAIQARGREYPVSLSYIAKQAHHLPDLQHLTERVSACVEQAMLKDDGDILVFLPGRAEIQACQTSLSGIDAEILPLHATISASERQYLLTAIDGERARRVILATNVAETSLTIPAISTVIDSGLERRTKQRAGRTVLSLERISRASSEQRRGRAGRVRSGHCYRLWGEYAPFEAVTPPQMQREELLEPMLFAASCGKALTQLAFLEALPDKSLRIASQNLAKMQALASDSQLSSLGKRLMNLPIDSYFSYLVNLMPRGAEQEAMLDLTAALTINRRLWQKPKTEHGLKQLQQWQPLACDMTATISLLRGHSWPEALQLNLEALKQAKEMAEQLRSVMGFAKLKQARPYRRELIIEALLSGASELAYVRRAKRHQAMGNGYAELQVARESLFDDEQVAALVLDQYSTPGRGLKQLTNIGLCLLPVSIQQLMRHQLGELKPSGELDGQGQQLMRRYYAGRFIGSEYLALTAAQYRRSLAKRILARQELSFTELSLQQDVDAWNLWVSLGEKNGGGSGEPIDAELWLSEHLQQLGLESAEDLCLIDAKDLTFPGIPEWQRAAFEQAFPQSLRLADLRVQVEYEVRVKRVTLHYQAGRRKDGPKRWELPSWAGWRVFYQKASKRVALT